MFFQMYYWHKKEMWKETFPPFLEHIFKETLSILRPKLKLCQSYEEAQTEVNDIRTSLGIGKCYTFLENVSLPLHYMSNL